MVVLARRRMSTIIFQAKQLLWKIVMPLRRTVHLPWYKAPLPPATIWWGNRIGMVAVIGTFLIQVTTARGRSLMCSILSAGWTRRLRRRNCEATGETVTEVGVLYMPARDTHSSS